MVTNETHNELHENTMNNEHDPIIGDAWHVLHGLRKVKSGMNEGQKEQDAGDLLSACALFMVVERLDTIAAALEDLTRAVGSK